MCTSQLNSLHVNPGSRDELSETTGDVSGNVSSAFEYEMQDSTARKARENTQNSSRTGRAESEYFQSEKHVQMLNDDSCLRPEVVEGQQRKNAIIPKEVPNSHSSDVQRRTVEDGNKKGTHQNRIGTTINDKDHKHLSSSVQPGAVVARQDKDSAKTKSELAGRTLNRCCGSEEQDVVNEGRTEQQAKNRSSFDKERTGEGNRKITSETGSCGASTEL